MGWNGKQGRAARVVPCHLASCISSELANHCLENRSTHHACDDCVQVEIHVSDWVRRILASDLHADPPLSGFGSAKLRSTATFATVARNFGRKGDRQPPGGREETWRMSRLRPTKREVPKDSFRLLELSLLDRQVIQCVCGLIG